MPARLTMSLGDWILLVILSDLWGGSFFFAKIAVDELPPLTVALVRVALAAALLMATMRLLGVALPRRCHTWAAFAVMGLINNMIPFTLIFWGQTHIASGLASILNATTPLFTVLVAHVATADEKVTPARLAGVAIGFLGVVVMIGPDALGELGNAVLARLACLVAAFSYALGGVYGRRFRGESPMAIAAGQMSASTVMLIPLVVLVDAPWALPAPSLAAILAVMALAALSTALAYVIYFRILVRGRHQPAVGHPPDPGERDPARRRVLRRGARASSRDRHGRHCARPRRDRRPPARADHWAEAGLGNGCWSGLTSAVPPA